jgi:hypothetical protein
LIRHLTFLYFLSLAVLSSTPLPRQELRACGERQREAQSDYLKLATVAENRIAKRDLARRIANDVDKVFNF